MAAPSSDILRRLDDERRNLSRFGEVLDKLPLVTRLRSAARLWHTVIASDLSRDNADQAIDAEIDHHRTSGAGFEWKVYSHDSPPDLLDRLRTRGFAIGARESVMVFDLADPPSWIAETAHRVVRIEEPGQIADIRRVAEAVFKKDYSLTSGELAAALAAGNGEHRGYVAYEERSQTPVSIGRLYTHPQSRFGGLYGGGTLAEYRGRGFYRAVLAARARDAISAGAANLIVDALPTSQPILERLSFRKVADTWPCEYRL